MIAAQIVLWFRSRHLMRFTIALVASVYFLWATYTNSIPWLLGNANFVFHEAGHIIFIFFGTYISVVGGSLVQILIPIICAAYFYIHKKYYSASLLLFWVSQSFLDVSIYAADAITQQLPLVGGDSVIHDWNYMLSYIGILPQTDAIAFFIRLLAILTLTLAVIFSLQTAKKQA